MTSSYQKMLAEVRNDMDDWQKEHHAHDIEHARMFEVIKIAISSPELLRKKKPGKWRVHVWDSQSGAIVIELQRLLKRRSVWWKLWEKRVPHWVTKECEHTVDEELAFDLAEDWSRDNSLLQESSQVEKLRRAKVFRKFGI